MLNHCLLSSLLRLLEKIGVSLHEIAIWVNIEDLAPSSGQRGPIRIGLEIIQRWLETECDKYQKDEASRILESIVELQERETD